MRVDVGGVGIHYERSGEGPAVVLLHGFPDSGRLWRHQVPALVAAGFSTLVPDLRGYGASDKPASVEAYRSSTVALDVLAMLDAEGVERAHVVGHDWGAAIAWVIASLHPERVERLVALSVGHPSAFARAGLRQRARSWYVLAFQFDGIAERWLSANGWSNFRQWSRHPDADAVVEALDRDGSLRPALAYYRANMGPSTLVEPPVDLPAVTAPTMGVWSSKDPALTEEQMTGSAGWVSGTWRYERIDGTGHWLPLEAADEVNTLLTDFLCEQGEPARADG